MILFYMLVYCTQAIFAITLLDNLNITFLSLVVTNGNIVGGLIMISFGAGLDSFVYVAI